MPRWALSIAVAALFSACAGVGGALNATIQDIMVRDVNPAAQLLWGAAGLESTAAGTFDLAPKSEADWEELRRGVMRLIKSADALTVRGRRVAVEGATLADASFEGNLKAPDIQTGIDGDFDAFVGRAWTLRDAGNFALDAIAKRNAEQLAEAGELVNDACSACHDAYWFPNSVQPIQ
jgi:hypothetical protein